MALLTAPAQSSFNVSIWPSIGEATVSRSTRFPSDRPRRGVAERHREAGGGDRPGGGSGGSGFYLDNRTQLNLDDLAWLDENPDSEFLDSMSENQARVDRRRKKTVFQSAKHIQADRMLTFTTRLEENLYSTSDLFSEFQRTRLNLKRWGFELPPYVGVPERHNSDKTSPENLDSLHLHTLLGSFADVKAVTRAWGLGAVNVRSYPDRTPEQVAGYLAGYLIKPSAQALKDDSFGSGARLVTRSRSAIPPVVKSSSLSLSDALLSVTDALGRIDIKHIVKAAGSFAPECWIVSAA